jgi:hypothetical protein
LEIFYPLKTTIYLVNEIGKEKHKNFIPPKYNENNQIMSLNDLASMGARLGNDEQIMLKIFQNAFRNGGDEEVIELAKSMTGQDVYPVSRGKYSFTPMYASEQLTSMTNLLHKSKKKMQI